MNKLEKINHLENAQIECDDKNNKFEIIESALLENVSGADMTTSICMCWQFCDMPPN
ncbi:hypothetical protein [Paraglaciecola marina]|uniref:hypothetical protein n=1 Tax=Paraglaciecola marina TaxID=2500157 RepID=UPI001414DFE0|nr:hypothetical protein [Paraglaciecola marina]